MKTNKKITVELEFIKTKSDSFLAFALYNYICEIDNQLDDNIGIEENEETNNYHFLYSYSVDDLKIKSKIEKHIAEFEKKFNLIEPFLAEKIKNDEINDSDEFYEQFKELSSSIVDFNGKLDKSLDNKTKNKRKI